MFLKTANMVIYIYLAMCGCMLLFNLASVLWRRRSFHIDGQRCMQWSGIFDSVAAGEEIHEKLLHMLPWSVWQKWQDESEEELLRHLLVQLSSLNAFQMELEDRLSGPEGEKLYSWLLKNKGAFVALSYRYYKKDDTVKAYYAYLMSRFRLAGQVETDPITQELLIMVTAHSLYLRENALMGLYSSGASDVVVRGFLRMAEAGVQNNGKLITDGLLTFRGDKGELAEALWKVWGKLPSTYQTAIVNFVRMSSGAFTQRFLPLLKDPTTDREVRLALLRYYRRYSYPPVLPVLLGFMAESNREGWEFSALAALAASTLESYPGEDTVTALAEALQHRNWYVRNNAAEAILRIAPDHPLVDEVFSGTDRFARDILTYKQEVLKQTEEAEGQDTKEQDAKAGQESLAHL